MIEAVAGARLYMRTRRSVRLGAARGLAFICLIIDQADNFTMQDLGGLLPSLASASDTQVVYAGRWHS